MRSGSLRDTVRQCESISSGRSKGRLSAARKPSASRGGCESLVSSSPTERPSLSTMPCTTGRRRDRSAGRQEHAGRAGAAPVRRRQGAIPRRSSEASGSRRGPGAFVRHDGLMFIDEVRRVPHLSWRSSTPLIGTHVPDGSCSPAPLGSWRCAASPTPPRSIRDHRALAALSRRDRRRCRRLRRCSLRIRRRPARRL